MKKRTKLLITSLSFIFVFVVFFLVGYFTASEENVAEPTEAEEVSINVANEVSNFDKDAFEQELFDKVNDVREINGNDKLEFSSVLSTIAEKHAKDMAVMNYTDFEDSYGRDVFERLSSEKQCAFDAGEIISEYYPSENSTAQDVVNDWMDDSLIATNIVGPSNDFTHGGVGVYCRDSDNKCYISFYLADLVYTDETYIDEGYLASYNLLPSNCNFKSSVNIDIVADSPINAYVVENSDDYDDLLHQKNVDAIKEWEDETTIHADDLEVVQGNLLVIENEGHDTVNFNVTISLS